MELLLHALAVTAATKAKRCSRKAGRLHKLVSRALLIFSSLQAANYLIGCVNTCGVLLGLPAGVAEPGAAVCVAEPGAAVCRAAPGKGPAADWGLDTMHASMLLERQAPHGNVAGGQAYGSDDN